MNKRTMVALVGSALLSSHAVANTDSVNEWGKWGQLFTAAGQPTINIPLNFNFNTGPNPIDSKKFVKEVQENERLYGVILSWDSRDPSYHYYYGSNSERVSSFQFTADESSASFSYTGDEGSSFSFNDLTNYYGNYYDDGNGNSHGWYERNYYNHTNPDEPHGYFSFSTSESNADSTYAYFWENLSDGESGSYTIGKYAYTLGGKTTDLNQLQQLASVSSASYNGYMYWGGYVSLNVNFKNASWSGTFDTDYYYENNQAGTLTVKNGSINGANLNASLANISSDTATLSKGSIEGSFFGDNAQQIAGIVDVTSQENGRYVTLFSAHDSSGKTPR